MLEKKRNFAHTPPRADQTHAPLHLVTRLDDAVGVQALDDDQLRARGERLNKSGYGRYLLELLDG